MPDAKITALTENTAPAATDLLAIVDDPAGTPATQKVTVQKLLMAPTTVHAMGNLGATETLNVANGTWQTGTLDADCTITVSGFTSGSGVQVIVELTQDGTGGRAVTWDPDITWIGDSASSPTAGASTFFLLWTSQGDSAIRGTKIGGLTFGTPALTLGTANAAGAASTAIRTDATILAFDSTAPAAVAGGAASAGAATVSARRDHQHGYPTFHGAKAKQAGSQNVATATGVKLNLDGEDYDSDAFHDNVTNNTRVTIPTGLGGKYMVTAEISYPTNATGSRQVYVKLNDTTYPIAGVYGNAGAANGTTVFCAGILALAAADYIELVAYQDSGSTLSVSLGRLSVAMVGA